MRVVQVDGARGWRGGQNQVLLTAAGLARRGHDVLVACREGGALAARARAAGLAVEEIPLGGDLSPRGPLALRRTLRAFSPDLVHAHDPHAVTAAVLASHGSPVVATRRVDFALRGLLSRVKYRRCAVVVAVSRAIAAVLERGRIEAARVRVVYEGVPDRAPAPGGREALAELGVPAGALVVGNVAALTGHKDHDTLLSAAARVVAARPRVYFVVVGDGERRDALRARVAEPDLAGRVVLAGFRDDVDRLLPACDVFCLSSHMEGLGTSLLDAMAFARPVVATAAGGIPEAVEDGVTGRLVPVRDAQALAGAILELVDDPALRTRMGEAARGRFLARFTAEAMVQATLEVYREVLG